MTGVLKTGDAEFLLKAIKILWDYAKEDVFGPKYLDQVFEERMSK